MLSGSWSSGPRAVGVSLGAAAVELILPLPTTYIQPLGTQYCATLVRFYLDKGAAPAYLWMMTRREKTMTSRPYALHKIRRDASHVLQMGLGPPAPARAT